MEFKIKATISTSEFRKLIKCDFDSWSNVSTGVTFYGITKEKTTFGTIEKNDIKFVSATELAILLGHSKDLYTKAEIIKFETGNNSDLIIEIEASDYQAPTDIHKRESGPYIIPAGPYDRPGPPHKHTGPFPSADIHWFTSNKQSPTNAALRL